MLYRPCSSNLTWGHISLYPRHICNLAVYSMADRHGGERVDTMDRIQEMAGLAATGRVL